MEGSSRVRHATLNSRPLHRGHESTSSTVTGTANVKTCRQPVHCHRLDSHWKAVWAGSGPGFPHSVIRASAPRVRRTRKMSFGVSRAPTGIDALMVTVFIGRRFGISSPCISGIPRFRTCLRADRRSSRFHSRRTSSGARGFLSSLLQILRASAGRACAAYVCPNTVRRISTRQAPQFRHDGENVRTIQTDERRTLCRPERRSHGRLGHPGSIQHRPYADGFRRS